MSVVEVTQDGSASLPPSSWESANARFATHWPAADSAVIRVDGEVDAANAAKLGDFTLQVALLGQYLVLDLSGVTFFGTEGFSTLHTMNVRCAKAGVRWSMVPSAAVSRVLRICDPGGGLPAAITVDAALAANQGEPRRLLHLVKSTPA
jgi:anti-anti-sigma factor